MLAPCKFRLSTVSTAAAALLTVASLALSGCGIGITAPPVSEAVSAKSTISGTVFGGSVPIVGATIAIWETDPGSTGYPSASNEKAKLLKSTTTNAAGGFSFTGLTYSCDAATGTTATGGGTAGPFLYLVSTGGNTGTNSSANNNAVLVNALGSCSYLLNTVGAANIRVNVNEATTLAAALSLGNFIYVDNTNPGSQGVYIGAPANNNAITGSCTSGTSMVCASAGLSHAFANAYNLVDAISYAQNPDGGAEPSGAARSTIVANPDTGVTSNSLGNSQAIVPQAELHALANALQYCVNSAGGGVTNTSGTYASDGSNCGNIFFDSPTASGTYPVDTLTAAINIVQNPSNNVSAIFNKIPPNPAYVPTLTAAPHDWSFAIVYPGAQTGTSTSFSFGEPQYVALDANDNVYVSAINNTGTNPTAGSLTALSSNGGYLWTTGNNATIAAPANVATDTAGNVWLANFETSTFGNSGTPGIYGFLQASAGSAVTPTYSFNTASTEDVASAPWAVAADRYNNIWYGRKQSTCNSSSATTFPSDCVAEIPYNSGSYGASTNIQPVGTLANVISILVDNNQNIWAAGYEATGYYAVGVIPNTASSGTPTYSSSSSSALQTTEPFGMLAIDASGDVWTGVPSALEYYTLSGTSISAPNTPSSYGGGTFNPSKPIGGTFDGNGRLYFTSLTSSGQLWFYNPAYATAGYGALVTADDLVPCYLPAASKTCSTTIASSYARSTQVDSTGALWLAAPAVGIAASATTVGYVEQVLGVAAPTWPQLSYAKFGVKPQ